MCIRDSFGIARASDGLGLTGTGQVMGTPQYLSPEQARGGTATPASDVYSLGVVAFECLAGHRPFDAESPVATALAHLNDPVPDLPPDVPADLAAVVRRAMSKDAGQRYADGDAFAVALRDPRGAVAAAGVPGSSDGEQTQVLAPTRPTPPPVTPIELTPTDEPHDEPARVWPVVLLVLALVAVIVLVVVLLVRGNGDDDPESEGEVSDTPTLSSSAPTTEDTPSEETSSAPAEVQINAADYLGRNVDVVAAELRDKGLKVDTQPVDNPGDEDADTVAAVRPTTGLVEGDTVTVEYYREAEPTPEPPSSSATSEPPSDTSTPSTPTAPSSTASQQDPQNPTTSAPAASASASRGAT